MKNLKMEIEKVLGNEVEIREILKNNGVKLTGVTIKGLKISPTIYINDLDGTSYNDYEKAIIIAKRFEKAQKNVDFDFSKFIERKNISENVIYRVVNRDLNKEKLENIPYKTVANDLAFIYSIKVPGIENGYITLTNEILEKSELSIIDIDECASANTRETLLVSDILSMLKEMGMPDDMIEEMADDNPMITVTNMDKVNGACLAFIPEVAKMLYKEYGAFYILPSSIHEVIIIPKDSTNDNSKADLDTMVREVNASELDPTEILSNHSYYYDGEKWN